jgi:hypothetical protein
MARLALVREQINSIEMAAALPCRCRGPPPAARLSDQMPRSAKPSPWRSAAWRRQLERRPGHMGPHSDIAIVLDRALAGRSFSGCAAPLGRASFRPLAPLPAGTVETRNPPRQKFRCCVI